MKSSRLFNIIYILLENKNVTSTQLAQTLEVSVRTIYRDIEALSMAGVPIISMPGKGGGVSLMVGYSFDKAMLTDKEQDEILFTLQSMKATEIDMDLDKLLLKLRTTFKKRDANWIEVDFSRWGHNTGDNKKFKDIQTAILEKRIITIKYCSSNGITSSRDVKPIKLIYKARDWYIQGFCMNSEGYRLFKISRILKLTLTENIFADIFSNPPPIDADNIESFDYQDIVLHFDKSLAFRVYEEFDLRSITLLSDGSFNVKVKFPIDNWLSSYLLSFGTSVEVIEPIWVKEELSKFAKEIFEHHKS